MEHYELMFLGFPIWWYTAPAIIKTFLESYEFSGKQVILFATSGGSGLGHTEEDLKPCVASNVEFLSGKVMNRISETELQKYAHALVRKAYESR